MSVHFRGKPMLAHKLDRADLARMAEEKDWWMSEKYDGVRAI